MIVQDFLKNTPNYEEVLNSKGVIVKYKDDLILLSYNLNVAMEHNIKIDFTDPIVKECRGIILNKDTFDVVCYPFSKFGNYTEPYADSIDWSSAKIQEKIDGSLMKLYYYNNKWNWSTSGMIDANDAPASDNMTFYDLVKSANNYADIDFESLDKNNTYMFELVSPLKRIVVQYNQTTLYHIGTRNNKTGKELNVDIGIRKPKEYDYSSLDECIKFVERLETYDGLLHEGFVVVDKDYHRVKIKSTSYLAMHRAIDNHKVFTLKRATEIIRANCIERYKDFPIEYEYLKKVEYDIAKIRKDIYEYLIYAINLFEENGYDKKSFALALRDSRFKFLAFEAIKQENHENLDIVNFIDSWVSSVPSKQLVEFLS